ncbi:MAG: HelD family protein [Acidimicrobiales bacterium]
MTDHLKGDVAREIAAEQAVLDYAHRRLESMRAAALSVSAGILELGAGGTHSARWERDARVSFTAQRLARLRTAEAGLIFGRTDHADGGVRHIGRVSVSDEDGEPLVVDWRAPASSGFYQATGRDPLGLVRRRHLSVTAKRVVALDDELLGWTASLPSATETSGPRQPSLWEPETQSAHGSSAGPGGEAGRADRSEGGSGQPMVLVGGAALLAALDQARTGRMGDIVATIQAEQDDIIRAPLPGVLLVEGGPGTGKTAVALHRAAYLLYTHRFPLERAGVLLIGPNQVHLRYIDSVLPALGEETVTLATPATLAGIGVVAEADPEVARIKGDARMAELVARAIRQRERALPGGVALLFRGQRLVLDRRTSARIVARARHRRGSHNSRRRMVEAAVLRHLAAQFEMMVPGPDLTADLVPIPAGLPTDVVADVMNERPLVEALERMWPVLSPQELLHDLFGARSLLDRAAEGLLKGLEADALYRPRSQTVTDVAWTDSDVALLDEAAAQLGPLPPRRAGGPQESFTRTWGHILVDEAQDLSPMTMRMLARRCPSGSMTLAGDLAQATGPWAPARWEDLLAHLAPRREPRRVQLSVNYRTPTEIMDPAAKVLAAVRPDLVASRALRSTGVHPRFTAVPGADLGSALAAAVAGESAASGGRSLVVLVPESLRALAARALPEAGEGVRALGAAVALLTPAQAKGLEFDIVVVVEPAAIVEESARGAQSLYLALTRATQRLHVVHSRPLPTGLDDPSAPRPKGPPDPQGPPDPPVAQVNERAGGRLGLD